MRANSSVIALATGTVIALALFVGAMALRQSQERQGTPAIPVDVQAISGSRYFYPADALPKLTLSGGRTKTIRSVLNVQEPLRFGDSIWEPVNVPPGDVWIRVDLTRQLLSVFRGGHEIGTAVVLYGAGDKPSPVGTFPVLQKAQDYYSRTYDAPMPFMLRLTDDGVAIHGSSVRPGAATHGCIGVPTEFARQLFAEVKLGDPVTIVQSAGEH